MWFLYGVSTVWVLSLLTVKLYNLLGASTYKTLDSHSTDDDDYILLCYVITYEDGEEEILVEATEEDIQEKDELSKIDHIVIKYMFNGKLMKYITRNLDIQFPIYNFNIEPTAFPYYPDIMFLNNVDVTDYLRPFLGPLCNFYSDREEPVTLRDALIDHPGVENIDFESGTFQIISNKTPLNGRKSFIKELPCCLTWKRHAAVDPRDEAKIGEERLKRVKYL